VNECSECHGVGGCKVGCAGPYIPLHVQQGAALRLLATIVERDPRFGQIARGSIGLVTMSTNTEDDPREALTYIAGVLAKYGLNVTVKNEESVCTVEARVSPVMRVLANASAAAMAQRPEYTPITIPTGGVA
jgi:hypothetical protein